MVLQVFATFGDIGRLIIASTITKRIRPPSRAGNGTRLSTAKLSYINAVNDKRYTTPRRAASSTSRAIPTGPDTCERSALPNIAS